MRGGSGLKQDITITHPLIAAEWDYEHNTQRPDEFLPSSNKRVSWICPVCRKPYWRKIVERTIGQLGCRHCTRLGEKYTSQQEQAFVFYLAKVTDVQNRANVFGREVDVFLPRLNAGIEYHGEYYHRNRAEKDKEKRKVLTGQGIRLITVQCGRVRTNDLDTITILSKPMENPPDDELEWAICKVIQMLALPLPNIDINRDRMDIYAQYIHTIKENSLSSRSPEIAAEWDYTRNHGLTPEMFSYGTNKKVWWICGKCGFSYSAAISSRTGGSGCRACAGKVVVKGINDLQTQRKDLLAIWNYERNTLPPDAYTATSQKKVWWKCDQCGHEWFAVIHSVASGCRCPECAKRNRPISLNRTRLQQKGSFAEHFPVLLEEWDYSRNKKSPDQYLSGSHAKVWWICKVCGNQWQMSIYCRTKMGQGCPKCGRDKSDAARHTNILARRGMLADQCPELLSEWDYDRNDKGPECCTKGSKEKVWWKCAEGHSWQARIYSRTRSVNPGGCPVCAGRVRCINLDTGEVFENYTEAGKSVGVTRKAITFAIKHGTKCKGFRWEIY